jgi:biotin-(acetyl-CoA carboxylase) ligase
VIVAKFFEIKAKNLKLKWPNDLWDEHGKKCGGILVQGTQNQFLAGIGINLYADDAEFGGVFKETFIVKKDKLARELGEFIISNRYHSTEDLRRDWLLRCGHLNQLVRVSEAGEIYEGVFQGLGEHGEALVCSDSKINHIFNGTLRTIC